jgi:uncharacterized membrane protein
MGQQLHNELKKEFQLERIILFSDAVFAIAITLLVIEIKIPEIHENVSNAALLHSLKHLIPKFVGFLVSFMLIGLYWTIHHRIFLFFIALMPFSTGFYSEYAGPELFRQQLKVPLTFYVLNFCCVGFTNYFMWRHITNTKNKLAEPPINALDAKLAKARSIAVPLVFLFMLPIAYLTNVLIAVYVPLLIPVVLRILKKQIHKKHKPVISSGNE